MLFSTCSLEHPLQVQAGSNQLLCHLQVRRFESKPKRRRDMRGRDTCATPQISHMHLKTLPGWLLGKQGEVTEVPANRAAWLEAPHCKHPPARALQQHTEHSYLCDLLDRKIGGRKKNAKKFLKKSKPEAIYASCQHSAPGTTV